MHKKIAIAFVLACSLANSDESHPYPYSTLKEILPYHHHSQYQNERMMSSLIKIHQPKIVVEVGSWMGASTIDIAHKLPEDGIVYAVDHWLGTPGEHQVSDRAVLPMVYDHFLSNIIQKGLTNKIIPVRMPSIEAAKWFKTFRIRPDLIYIDAAHDEVSVYEDLTAWFPLIEGHGIMCGDDWVMDGVRHAVTRFAKERNFRISLEGIGWILITN